MRTGVVLVGLTALLAGCNPTSSQRAAACGGAPPRPDREVAQTAGDFDGDGRADRAVLYEQAADRPFTEDERRVRVDLAERVVDGPVTVEGLLRITAGDVDGDRRDELFLAGAGNTVNGLTLAQVDGCQLVEVTGPDGRLFFLSYGAHSNVGGSAGGWCADTDNDGRGDLVEVGAEPDRDAISDRNGNGSFDLGDLDEHSPYRWTRTVHRLAEGVATPMSETSGRVESGGTAAELTNEFVCGAVDTGRSG